MKGALIRHCVTCAACGPKLCPMAIFHLSAQTISRATGRSATGAAAYRSAGRFVDERTGLVFDYTKKLGVDHSVILAPDHAPDWALDRSRLWNAVEAAEKRRDSQLCREVEVALPVELSFEQQRDLVERFASAQFVEAGMVADLAMHHTTGHAPHCHILLTMRDIGPAGFGAKNRSWNDKQLLQQWREAWARDVNAALERVGSPARVDHRTLAAQGIARLPQPKIGAKVAEMERRGVRTERGSAALEVERINEAIEALASDMEAITNERAHAVETSADARPGGRGPGAVGPKPGQPGRPSANQRGGREPRERGPGGELERAADGGGAGGAGGGRPGAELRGDPEAGQREPEGGRRPGAAGASAPAAHLVGGVVPVGHPRLSALDRILALAGPRTAPADAGRPGGGRAPAASADRGAAGAAVKPDRSYLAARRQLEAMGGDEFELGIRDRAGRMLTRVWTRAQTLLSMAWLKRENSQGADVYVRPAGDTSSGLILVDDLDRGAIERMTAEGLEPACVVETSPDNHQVWVRLSRGTIAPELATEAARALAKRYGGDPNSADWKHFGRLAGLTNNKPSRRDGRGRAPYVLAHASSGRLASRGAELLAAVAVRQRQRQAEAERDRRAQAAQAAQERGSGRDPVQAYQTGWARLYARHGAAADLSRLDFALSADMLKRGFSPDQVALALEQASPELPARKAGHEADYVSRTVRAASQHPEVQAAQAARQAELERLAQERAELERRRGLER